MDNMTDILEGIKNTDKAIASLSSRVAAACPNYSGDGEQRTSFIMDLERLVVIRGALTELVNFSAKPILQEEPNEEPESEVPF